jgi:hypothetical protein
MTTTLDKHPLLWFYTARGFFIGEIMLDKTVTYRYATSSKKYIDNLQTHYKTRLPKSMEKSVDKVCNLLKGDLT